MTNYDLTLRYIFRLCKCLSDPASETGHTYENVNKIITNSIDTHIIGKNVDSAFGL